MPKIRKKYTQKFRFEWMKDPLLKDWLSYKEGTNGERIAKCKFCDCELSTKYSDLKTHCSSKKHENKMDASLRERIKNLTPSTEVNKVKSAECSTALFIAEHFSILAPCDHLGSICNKSFSDSKIAEQFQMHRTKCSAVIKNVLYPHFKDNVKQDIGDGSYSLIIDESTDISVSKYLGIAIIYYSKTASKIVTTFFSLAKLDFGNAKSIVTAIKETLINYEIDIEKMIGIGTDNASRMTNVNNEVYTKLKKEVPRLILFRCVCHSLQLAFSTASANTLPSNLEYIISQTYNWFLKSTNRQLSYESLYSAINANHEPLKIVQEFGTRWLSIETAVSRIIDQWIELKTHFDTVRLTEKCYNAEILYNMYNDDANLAYLLFIKPILGQLHKVNNSFEAVDADQTKLFNDLIFLISSLVQKIVLTKARIDPLTANLKEYADPKPYLGYQFEKKIEEMRSSGFNEDSENQLRKRCVNLLISLVYELRQRLPDNVNVLKNLALLGVDQAMRVDKESLVPLLEFMHLSATDITEIETQWQNITLVKWRQYSKTSEFWIEVMNYKDASYENPYKLLSKFAISMLILPYSNAEVERVFGQMNCVKTKLPNKIKRETVNALFTIRAGLRRNDKKCFEYQLPVEVINKIGTKQVYEAQNEDDDEDEFL